MVLGPLPGGDDLVVAAAQELSRLDQKVLQQVFHSLKTAHDMLLGLSLIHISEPTAHETVLDLVCRLLLEKKKKTQQHPIDSLQV